jgi:dihydrofolate reductase
MIVSIIAAVADGNRGIGYQGRIPWKLPADLATFRNTTMGHTLIMGRITYESLGGPLEGRRIIVLTTSVDSIEGVEVARSLEAALEIAADDQQETETFIAGGEDVYSSALELGIVDRMILTLVHATVEADTYFPEYMSSEWEELQREIHPADEQNQHPFTFLLLQKK